MSVGVGEGQLAVPPGGGHLWPPWMDAITAPPLDVGAVRRLLVVRTDHLGDLILSTPFLETVRRSFPRSRVTALVTPYTRPVLEGNPSVDAIRTIEPRRDPGDAAVMRALKGEAYDAVIVLSPTMRAYAIARSVKAPIRAGYIYSRRWVPRALSGVLLTHRAVFHIDALVERGHPVPHEVEQMLWFARMLGLSAEPVATRLYPNQMDTRQALQVLGDDATRGDDCGAMTTPEWNTVSRRDCPWLAVHLSASWLKPPWSPVAFRDLLGRLLDAIPEARVVVTYGPPEAAAGRELAASYAGSPRVRVVGDLPFGPWAALLGTARMAVSADTGALHVASAVRTPVVAAYEDATFALCSQQWAPWMVPHRKVRKAAPAQTIPALADAAAALWKPGR